MPMRGRRHRRRQQTLRVVEGLSRTVRARARGVGLLPRGRFRRCRRSDDGERKVTAEVSDCLSRGPLACVARWSQRRRRIGRGPERWPSPAVVAIGPGSRGHDTDPVRIGLGCEFFTDQSTGHVKPCACVDGPTNGRGLCRHRRLDTGGIAKRPEVLDREHGCRVRRAEKVRAVNDIGIPGEPSSSWPRAVAPRAGGEPRRDRSSSSRSGKIGPTSLWRAATQRCTSGRRASARCRVCW